MAGAVSVCGILSVYADPVRDGNAYLTGLRSGLIKCMPESDSGGGKEMRRHEKDDGGL